MEERYKLYHGDCLELMKQIPDGSVDMILCDLPYGVTTCKWDVVIPFEPLWEQYWRVLKKNGAVLLFGSEPFSSTLRMSQLKHYKYDWIWDKYRGSGMCNAKIMPMKRHEIVSVFINGRNFYFPQMELRDKPIKNGGMQESLSGGTKGLKKIKKTYTHKFPTSILSFKKVNFKTVHPTQKPVPLLEYLIKTYTIEGETVLDNCMGSGSTGVACLNTRRKFIGIEKDDKYFEIAENRIKEAEPKEDESGV